MGVVSGGVGLLCALCALGWLAAKYSAPAGAPNIYIAAFFVALFLAALVSLVSFEPLARSRAPSKQPSFIKMLFAFQSATTPTEHPCLLFLAFARR